MSARILRCSFCAKTQDEVRKLIAGPDCFICNECVDLCGDIIAAEPEVASDGTAARLDRAITATAALFKEIICKATDEADVRRIAREEIARAHAASSERKRRRLW